MNTTPTRSVSERERFTTLHGESGLLAVRPRLRFGLVCAFAFVVLVAVFGAETVVRAQDEEDEAAAAMQVQANFEVGEENFDQWVFGNQRNAAGGRKRLETQLKLQSDEVERACKLTEAQKKKLQLAGRGDIKRFYDRVEEVRKKFLLVRKDQQKFQEIWQDIQPLQMTLNSGLFDDQSFFHKTLRRTLNAEQAEHYELAEHQRRTFRYRAKVELVVATLENGLPLRDEQRRKLIQLILDETKPPRKFGQYDYYMVMLQVSKLPENKLKPLFDNAQWKVLNQQFNQVKGLGEEFFKQNGGLATDAEADE